MTLPTPPTTRPNRGNDQPGPVQSRRRLCPARHCPLSHAAVSTFKTKYTYHLLRPFTYIRNVPKKATWNPVIPTPPHPEYSAAHAVVSGASAAVLEKLFGTSYKFSDNSYESSYGVRSYNTFQEYAQEAGRSRLLGGIHYGVSISAGLFNPQLINHSTLLWLPEFSPALMDTP